MRCSDPSSCNNHDIGEGSREGSLRESKSKGAASKVKEIFPRGTTSGGCEKED